LGIVQLLGRMISGIQQS